MATWAATAIATATVGATRYFNRYRFFSQKGRRKIISTNNVTFSKLFFVQDGFLPNSSTAAEDRFHLVLESVLIVIPTFACSIAILKLV